MGLDGFSKHLAKLVSKFGNLGLESSSFLIGPLFKIKVGHPLLGLGKSVAFSVHKESINMVLEGASPEDPGA
jgi:hypothetical protein